MSIDIEKTKSPDSPKGKSNTKRDRGLYLPSHLTVKGGGVKGLAYLGTWYVLTECGIDVKITDVAGASAGIIFGTMVACRMPYEKIRKTMMEVDFNKFKDDSLGVIRDGYRLWHKLGICKGDYFAQWFRDMLGSHTGNPDITLMGILTKYGRSLHVVVTDLSFGKPIIYTPVNCKDIPVYQLARMSMSIPLFFTAIRKMSTGLITDTIKRMHILIDGGTLLNYYSFPGKAEDTLGLYLIGDEDFGDEPVVIDNVVDEVKALIDMWLYALEHRHIPSELWKNTLNINTGKIKATQFNLTPNNKFFLLNQGTSGAFKYLYKKMSAGYRIPQRSDWVWKEYRKLRSTSSI